MEKKRNPNWGGARPGSGPKRKLPLGARARSIKMTDKEHELVKNFLKELRNADK